MKYLISGTTVCTAEGISCYDNLVNHGRGAAIAPLLPAVDNAIVMDAKEFDLFPDFVDVYIHLREPGFFI